jgi:hypothetical protein
MVTQVTVLCKVLCKILCELNDYVSSAPVNFDCCFENFKGVKFEDLLLHVPLVNMTSSVDDLRVASMKMKEVQQTIEDQEIKYNENLYMVATS